MSYWEIIFGVGLGFILSLITWGITYGIKEYKEEKSNKEYLKKLLNSCLLEIFEGIERCDWLIKCHEDNVGSFSRIYTKFWDSSIIVITSKIRDDQILKYLHKIYYRFDLINFNMEGNRFGSGGAFAKQYTKEIKSNYKKLKKLVGNY